MVSCNQVPLSPQASHLDCIIVGNARPGRLQCRQRISQRGVDPNPGEGPPTQFSTIRLQSATDRMQKPAERFTLLMEDSTRFRFQVRVDLVRGRDLQYFLAQFPAQKLRQIIAPRWLLPDWRRDDNHLPISDLQICSRTLPSGSKLAKKCRLCESVNAPSKGSESDIGKRFADRNHSSS